MATFEKRGNKYRAKVRVQGTDKKYVSASKTFLKMSEAKQWAFQKELDIKDGLFFKKADHSSKNVSDLISKYQEYLKIRAPEREIKLRTRYNWWRSKIGHYIISDLMPDMIQEPLNQLLKEQVPNKAEGVTYSYATANRYKSAIQTALSEAVDSWGWINENPAQKVKNFREPEGRTRFLSKEELSHLLECSKASDNKMLYSIVILALSSGARLNEIRYIKWSDVLLDENKIILTKTKNKKQRVIHLAHEAKDEIIKLHKYRDYFGEFVFQSENDSNKPLDFRRAWRTTLRRADIHDFKFHDLRHTAASYLAMSGAGMRDIAEVLGHQSLSMVKRYAHLSESHTAMVVKRMNEELLDGNSTMES